jgi:hypothetical protein
VTGQFTGVGPGIPISTFGPTNALAYASINTTLTVVAGSIAATLGSATGLANGASIYSPAGLIPPGTTINGLSGTNFNLALPTLSLPGTLLANGQIVGLNTVAWLQGATVTGPGLPAAGLTVVSTQAPAPNPGGFPVAATFGDANGLFLSGGTVQLSGTATPVSVRDGATQFFQFKLAAAGIPASGADANAIFTGAGITFNATIQLERSLDGGNTWVVTNAGGTGTLAQYSGATVTPISFTFAEPEEGATYRWNCIAYTSGTLNYRISTTGGAATAFGSLNQLA